MDVNDVANRLQRIARRRVLLRIIMHLWRHTRIVHNFAPMAEYVQNSELGTD